MRYDQQRQNLYGQIAQEKVFTWHELYGQEYALPSCHGVRADFLEEIAFATQQLGAVFAKTAAHVQYGCDSLLAMLAIPPAAFDAVRLSIAPQMPTVIGRFDFARTPFGLKLLEFNADTPGYIVEAFYLNGAVCRHFGLRDPNAGREADLAAAFRHIVGAYGAAGYAVDSIVFSSLDWHEEDAGTTRYLLDRSGLPGRFVPLQDLRVDGEMLYALDGESLLPVDMLYRLHPLGILADETDTDGYPSGAQVLSLAVQGRLAMVNPPGALIAQTKALQALIWSLAETGDFFTDEECRVIRTYMLPTYLEDRFFGRKAYCTKPVLGREGGGITLYDAARHVLDRDGEDRFRDQPVIYQELAELEQLTVPTAQGMFTGYVVWGSFLVGGRPSAVSARLGGRITDDLSYFLPLCLI